MDAIWPPLPYAEWRDTLETLHRWTQILGKVRLALSPTTNHFWSSALHVTTRGLSTTPCSYGWDLLELELDFRSHSLVFRTSRGDHRELPLRAMTVAEFHEDVFE